MSEILGNICIDRFLLLVFVKYFIVCFITVLQPLYSELYFLILCRDFETFVFWRKYFQSLLIFMFFIVYCFIVFYYVYLCLNYNITLITLITYNIIGRRKLSDPSMNYICNVLSIGLQNTLSFKWPNFGLECLVTITPEGQPLKFNASVLNFPISETGRFCNSLSKVFNSNWVIIIEQKRKMEYSWACTFPVN